MWLQKVGEDTISSLWQTVCFKIMEKITHIYFNVDLPRYKTENMIEFLFRRSPKRQTLCICSQ